MLHFPQPDASPCCLARRCSDPSHAYSVPASRLRDPRARRLWNMYEHVNYIQKHLDQTRVREQCTIIGERWGSPMMMVDDDEEETIDDYENDNNDDNYIEWWHERSDAQGWMGLEGCTLSAKSLEQKINSLKITMTTNHWWLLQRKSCD